MKDDVVPIARATLRNAAGMSIVGLLAKAMGLVVGVLVARYLGPKGLGLFAFLLGLSIIAEQVGSFGAPDVVLRAVGARGRWWPGGTCRCVFRGRPAVRRPTGYRFIRFGNPTDQTEMFLISS